MTYIPQQQRGKTPIDQKTEKAKITILWSYIMTFKNSNIFPTYHGVGVSYIHASVESILCIQGVQKGPKIIELNQTAVIMVLPSKSISEQQSEDSHHVKTCSPLTLDVTETHFKSFNSTPSYDLHLERAQHNAEKKAY